MARNLRDEGYPASHTDPPFKSRKVNYAEGTGSVKRTTPTQTYMRGESFELDDNRQQDYINALLDKVGSPFNVKRWNSRLNISNADWQDSINKGYSVNDSDGTRMAYIGKVNYPSGLQGTNYSAVIDNLEPILGDGYKDMQIKTPIGTFGAGYEDGSVYADYTTPSLKEQMYYINALANLLRR